MSLEGLRNYFRDLRTLNHLCLWIEGRIGAADFVLQLNLMVAFVNRERPNFLAGNLIAIPSTCQAPSATLEVLRHCVSSCESTTADRKAAVCSVKGCRRKSQGSLRGIVFMCNCSICISNACVNCPSFVELFGKGV